MAYKPLLDTNNILIIKQIINALNDFDLDPQSKQTISEIVFTKKSLLKELKKQKISPKDLPKILESISLKKSLNQNQDDLPTTSVPNIKTATSKKSSKTTPISTDYTTNIDDRNLSKFRSQQIEQMDAILKKSTIASIQAKKALGKRVSTEASKEIDALAWKLVVLDPQINPNTLATKLFENLQTRTANLIPKNPTKAKQVQKNIKTSLLKAKTPTPQSPDQTHTHPQKTSLWITQIADEVQSKNPTLSKSQAIKAAVEIRQTIQAIATSVNPINVQTKDLQAHLSQSILSASKTIESSTHTTLTKTPLSTSLVKSINPQLLKIALVEESRLVAEKLTPKLLPTQKLNHSSTSLVLNKIRSFTQKPEDFGDFIIEINNRYQYITTNKSLPQYINSPQTYFRRVISQIFSKGTSVSPPNEIINVIQNIPISKPSISFMPGGGKLSISPKLSNPLKNFGSGLKKLFGKGFGGAKSLLRKGGPRAARGVSKLMTMLASIELAPVFLTIAAAVGLIFIVLFLMNYNNETLRIFPNITTTNMGGGKHMDSKYATINKTADITKLENPVGKITYQYTISALEGSIQISSFVDKTTIYQESGSKTISLTTEPNSPPDNIEASGEFTSNSFYLNLSSSMDNAMITNSIEITFINPEGETETLSSAAITIIGNPPFCPPTLEPTAGSVRGNGYEYVCSRTSNCHTSWNSPTDYDATGHCGLDLSGGSYLITSPFNCPAVVERVVNTTGESFGSYVVLRSGPYYAFFTHLQEGTIDLIAGQTVNPGEVLGTMDNTGNSYGDHLHYEIRNAEKAPVNITSNCQPGPSGPTEDPCKIPGTELSSGACNY